MGNQYDLEQAQDRLNRIYIGNLESDLLAGEGWVANRPSCRSKWSEGEEACQCFLLYILTCIKLINPQGWYLHQMELESGYDFPEVVMTTEGVWDDVTFRHQIYHWLSWVFTMQFPWLNLTKDFACETTAIKPSFCALLGFEVMLYFSQQWEHSNSQPTTTNLIAPWLLSLHWFLVET